MSGPSSWGASAGDVEVAFSLGSNMGDKASAVRRALLVLEAAGIAQGLRGSPLYATPPWGPVAQDGFVNACAVGTTTLDAFALLRRVKAVEVALGRVAGPRWGPRAIDIDLLYRGCDDVDAPELTLPHRHMLERAFVLVPLSDLVPDRVVRGVTVAEAAARLGRVGIERLAPA